MDRQFTSSLFKKLTVLDLDGWQRFAVVVAWYARVKCGDAGVAPQDYEDVASEVCADVLRHIHDFRGELTGDNLHHWVRAITRAKIADYKRARARRPEDEPVGGPESALAQVPQEAGDTRECIPNEDAQRSTLHTAMALVRARVSPPTWEAFCSVAIECRDGGEVAAKLHMTPGAVREAVYHVRQLLKECLTQLVKVRNDSA